MGCCPSKIGQNLGKLTPLLPILASTHHHHPPDHPGSTPAFKGPFCNPNMTCLWHSSVDTHKTSLFPRFSTFWFCILQVTHNSLHYTAAQVTFLLCWQNTWMIQMKIKNLSTPQIRQRANPITTWNRLNVVSVLECRLNKKAKYIFVKILDSTWHFHMWDKKNKKELTLCWAWCHRRSRRNALRTRSYA